MQKQIHKVFLSGICGTAMASLGRNADHRRLQCFRLRSGRIPSDVDVSGGPGHSPCLKASPETHIKNAAPDLVVIGNALSRGNPEVEHVLDTGIRYSSMAETLKEFFIPGASIDRRSGNPRQDNDHGATCVDASQQRPGTVFPRGGRCGEFFQQLSAGLGT